MSLVSKIVNSRGLLFCFSGSLGALWYTEGSFNVVFEGLSSSCGGFGSHNGRF